MASNAWPLHKPWCRGVSHDGECPPENSPLFARASNSNSQPDTNMSRISSSTPASAEMPEWVWRRIASARAVRDARATRGRTVGASEVIVLVLADRVESLTREVEFAWEHIGKGKFAGRPDDIVRLHADSIVTSDFWRNVARAELQRRARSSSTPEASHAE